MRSLNENIYVSNQHRIWQKDLKDPKKAKQIKVHQFAKEVVKDLKPESKILSLGCGAGLDEIFFAKKGHFVVATNFLESAINELNERIKKEKITNLKAKVQDIAEPFVFWDEFFDAVYSHLSLNFITDAHLVKAIKEIRRVLKPNGAIYIIALSVSDKDYSDKTFGKGKEIEKDTFLRNGKFFHYFSREYLEKRFSEFGFRVEDVVTGKRIFFPPDGRVMGFIQFKARKSNTGRGRGRS
jgi:cyclopropane fatty-acyl-phospholipid synthase-like methyltransferase